MYWNPNFAEFDLEEHSILVTLSGSRAYGTDHPLSDTDVVGIAIPPKEYQLNPFKNFEQTHWQHNEGFTGRISERAALPEHDFEATIYNLRKFIVLAAECNPNIIEVLFTDPKHHLLSTSTGRLLVDHRYDFLSQRAAHRFAGYATSQLKRIYTHKHWLDNPPDHRPTREEFDLPPTKLIPGEQLGAAEKLVQSHLNAFAPWLLEADNTYAENFWEGVNQIVAICQDPDSWLAIRQEAEIHAAKTLGFDSNFVLYLQNEKAYAQAVHNYELYEKWLVTRNPARAELEARYGYDCKHAMHLVRLLRMGKQILLEGELDVYRPDREELLQIRNGQWPFADLIKWADQQTLELRELTARTDLAVPKRPDLKRIESIYLNALEEFYNESRSNIHCL